MTDFFVYRTAISPFQTETDTLIVALQAEPDSTTTELDPTTDGVRSGHFPSTIPSVVAERNGVALQTINFNSAAEMDPPTLLSPGGLLADDTLDALEADPPEQFDPDASPILHRDVSQDEGFIRKTGERTYEAIKTNLNATTSPGVGDDADDGYSIGSMWIDTVQDVVWVCADPTVGAAVWVLTGQGGAGESNTASNVGTAGTGVFKEKVGVDLRFKKLNAASPRLSIVDDVANSKVDVDVVPDQIDLDDLGDVVTAAPQDFDLLSWDDHTQKWINRNLLQTLIGAGAIDHGNLNGLTDDDHVQYHNDARALTWLNGRSIDALADVDTTTVPPVAGDHIVWDGTKWVTSSAIIHIDRSSAEAVDNPTTISTGFVDLPGMTLTTDNDIALEYLIWFSGSFQGTIGAQQITVQIVVDGVAIPASVRTSNVPGANSTTIISTIARSVNLGNAKIVKVQWLTTAGVATAFERTLMFCGQPS